MTVTDLERMYDYGAWANRKLLAVVSELTPEQFALIIGGGHGSVRNTLVHALSAEWGWLERCGGHARGAKLRPHDYPNVESLIETLINVERWVRAFLATLRDEDLDRSVEFRNARGEVRSMALGELLQHAANHGVHHRGQVALLLRLLGRMPGDFDMLLYDAERHGVSAW